MRGIEPSCSLRKRRLGHPCTSGRKGGTPHHRRATCRCQASKAPGQRSRQARWRSSCVCIGKRRGTDSWRRRDLGRETSCELPLLLWANMTPSVKNTGRRETVIPKPKNRFKNSRRQISPPWIAQQTAIPKFLLLLHIFPNYGKKRWCGSHLYPKSGYILIPIEAVECVHVCHIAPYDGFGLGGAWKRVYWLTDNQFMENWLLDCRQPQAITHLLSNLSHFSVHALPPLRP